MNNYSTNTDSYFEQSNPVPLESTGIFFIPANSINIPFLSFSTSIATALEKQGLQRSVHDLAFQFIPLVLECPENKFAQQMRGLQRCPALDIPDIPDASPLTSLHCSLRATPYPNFPSQEVHRRDCLARHLLHHWSRQEIVDWLNDPKKTNRFREDMRERLNTQRHIIKPQ